MRLAWRHLDRRPPRYRRAEGSHARAAFLSVRNGTLANIGIIAAGRATASFPSIWPDIVVSLILRAHRNSNEFRTYFSEEIGALHQRHARV